MKLQSGPSIKEFAIELGIYALLVAAYFALVLHFLGDWLRGLFDQNKYVYGFVALGLIVGQGVLLDAVTSVLLRLVRGRFR